MDQTLPPPRMPGLLASFRAGLGFVAQLLVGAVLIFVASLIAMLTALAGVVLAAAALTLRYAAVRRPVPVPVRVKDAPVTLQARRTPRGWTVE